MKTTCLFLTLSLVTIPCLQGFSTTNHNTGRIPKLNLLSQHDFNYNNHNVNRISQQTTTCLSLSPLDIASTIYNQALLTNPLETKLVTGGILALLGDYIAQRSTNTADDGKVEYDVKRAGAFISFDIMYRAVQCALFPEITRICDGHFLGSIGLLHNHVDLGILATLEQTMSNQFIIIPLIYYPLFFSLTGWVQGLSQDAAIERAQTTIVPLLKRNWLFWIPVQYFQFGYVDEPLQIPFLCVVGLAWTFILSLAAGSVQTYDQEGEEPLVVNSGLVAVAATNSTVLIEL